MVCGRRSGGILRRKCFLSRFCQLGCCDIGSPSRVQCVCAGGVGKGKLRLGCDLFVSWCWRRGVLFADDGLLDLDRINIYVFFVS